MIYENFISNVIPPNKMNLINKNSKSPLLALLNSKRLEISPKNGWRARVAGEPMTSFPNWRGRCPQL